MSCFLSVQGVLGFSGVLVGSDERAHPENFRWYTPRPPAPWVDGALWPASRGLAMGFVLGNDASAAGRWGAMDDTGSTSMKKIIGTTRDANGNPLGNCVVKGFLTASDTFLRQMTSDAVGYYEFCSENSGVTHYLVAYLAGSPDVEGTTVNTLQPV